MKNAIGYVLKESKVTFYDGKAHYYRKGERRLLALVHAASIVDAIVWILTFGKCETNFREVILFSPWVENLE